MEVARGTFGFFKLERLSSHPTEVKVKKGRKNSGAVAGLGPRADLLPQVRAALQRAKRPSLTRYVSSTFGIFWISRYRATIGNSP